MMTVNSIIRYHFVFIEHRNGINEDRTATTTTTTTCSKLKSVKCLIKVYFSVSFQYILNVILKCIFSVARVDVQYFHQIENGDGYPSKPKQSST